MLYHLCHFAIHSLFPLSHFLSLSSLSLSLSHYFLSLSLSLSLITSSLSLSLLPLSLSLITSSLSLSFLLFSFISLSHTFLSPSLTPPFSSSLIPLPLSLSLLLFLSRYTNLCQPTIIYLTIPTNPLLSIYNGSLCRSQYLYCLDNDILCYRFIIE